MKQFFIICHYYCTLLLYTTMNSNIKILLEISLLSERTASSRLALKTEAAKFVIDNYGLSLVTEEEIMIMFYFLKRNYSNVSTEKKYFIINTLLKDNTNMFVAFVKAYNDDNFRQKYKIEYYVNETIPLSVGYRSYARNIDVYKAYKKLLRYGDFNIDYLVLPENYKLKIIGYRNTRYGGKLTKVATN